MFAKYLFAAAALAVVSPASAVTVVNNQMGAPDLGMPTGFTTVIDFDSPIPAGITNTTTGSVYTGPATVPGQYAAPAGTALGTNYQGVQGGASSTFQFTGFLPPSGLISGLSFYWGSIDTYNTLQFLRADGSIAKTFTGGDFPPANGSQPDNVTNRRITFGMDRSDGVTGVKFSSGSNAFEFDTIGLTTSVPEPASWAMLIAGFGLVGATMRRRRRTMACVTN